MSNNKKLIKKNWPRYVLQWGVLAALVLFLTGLIKTAEKVDPEAYCPVGGLEAFTTYLVRGSLPCSMSSLQIMIGLAAALAVMLFSKLFCAYICPVGTVEDLLKKLRETLGIKNISIRNQSVADKVLRIFKYVMLFWIFYMTATASELFCKHLDPYYAVATGFKGEITLWMSITTLAMVIIGGLLVDNFWCRYICPLGAASNTFKFWVWVLVLAAVTWLLNLCPFAVPWWVILGAFCLMGYLLEIFCSNPKFQILNVIRDDAKCTNCKLCEKQCPYHIDITSYDGRVNNVDCMLCGECVAVCHPEALHVGACKNGKKNWFTFILPALLTVVFAVAAYFIGQKNELPTINEQWGIYADDSLHTQLVDPSTLESTTMEGLSQIHCWGSSMAFKGKLENVKGVYGVKTYVKHHKATILYDPAVTSPEQIAKEIYVPSSYKCHEPDWRETPTLKVLTVRTEHMPASTDLNFLGIQFRFADTLVYGVDSQWDCPLIVHMYVDPAFDKDEEWIKEMVEKPTLDFKLADGSIKQTPLGPNGKGFDFVRVEDQIDSIATTDFLLKMFKSHKHEFKKEIAANADKAQYILEFEDKGFDNPFIARSLMYLAAHLSNYEGVLGVYTALDAEYIPALQVRFCEPMTAEKLFETINMPKWSITYSDGEVKDVDATIQFDEMGKVLPYTPKAE